MQGQEADGALAGGYGRHAPRRRRLRLMLETLALAVAVTALAPPAAAGAGTYTVHACDGAPRAVNNSWREHDHRGMLAGTLCPTRGELQRGLAVRNRVNAGTVRQGKGAFMTFSAPGGATLRSIELDWHGRRVTGDWRLGLVRGGGRLLAGCRPTRGGGPSACRLGDAKGSSRVRRSLGGASSVRVEASCAASRGCDTAAALPRREDRTRARLAVHRAAVEVEDRSVPNLDASGSLLRDGWQRDWLETSLLARDNVGVRSTALRVGGAVHGVEAEPCDYTRPVPCPRAVRRNHRLDTRELPDGRHAIALTAVDAAGNVRALERTIQVDNHAPGPATDLRVVGGEALRSTNSFDLRWTAPPGQAAPIARAHLRLCREAAPASCVTGHRDGAAQGMDGLSVPSRGNWRLRVWLEDAAGNTNAGTASASVMLRFDDRTPARVNTGIAAAGRPAARRAKVDFGARPLLEGTVVDANGTRISNAPLVVSARPQGADVFRRVGSAATDRSGEFRHRLGTGPSRTVRVTYPGSSRHRPADAEAQLTVRATSTIGVSRHRVRNGQRVRFDGRLLGGPVPKKGKLVQLEAFYRDRWRTFTVVRTNPEGDWTRRYRFEATTGRVRYPFRAWVPRERDYPYAAGRSRVVRVTVNGR